MKRTSINTTTSLSTNTKTTNLETDTKTSLKKYNSIKNDYKTPKKFNSYQKSYINFKDTFNFSFRNNSNKSEISSSIENSESISNESETSYNQTSNKSKKLNIKKIHSIKKHKKISNLPYNLKNNETLKLQYINNHMKKKSKLPKYSSDGIGIKLKKDIYFPNTKIFSKKSKKNFLLSSRKKFEQKKLFLSKENKYVSFGLYYDKDIMEKSEELNLELIENDNDMDCESDDENIMSGIDMCLYDIQKAISEIKKNSKSISYIKKNKAEFY